MELRWQGFNKNDFMKKITQVTRKAIFDEMRINNLFYLSNEIEEVEFWNRLYNLSKLASMDERFKDMAGDMWQHRVNNPMDWDDYWFLSDSRINMMTCSDEEFLKFLSETMHPLVRSDKTEIKKLLEVYNKNLREDGYEIAVIQTISGRGIYDGKKINENKFTSQSLEDVSNKINYLGGDYLHGQIELMKIQTNNNPEQAIGLSKEIIESFCKAILEDEGEKKIDRFKFPELVKKTNAYLGLLPQNVSQGKRGAETIKSILGSVANIANKLDELRNLYGSGHGKAKSYKGLTKRHATMVVNLTSSLILFWLETYETKKDNLDSK